MNISAVKGLVRLASLGAAAVVAVMAGSATTTATAASRTTLAVGRCVTAGAGSHRCVPRREADWSSTHVLRYYGGPKQPMYWARRD